MPQEKVKTIPIKGKEYATVNERLKAFRIDHPTWTLAIDKDMTRITDDVALIVTYVADETGRIIAMGSAREEKKASNINSTSYVENCESSSWGRCLANIGYCIDGSIASAEEVENAKEQQAIEEARHKPITSVELDALRVIKEEDICKAYKDRKEINMNVVILIGRLARDVDVRSINTKSGEPLAIGKFTLAVPVKGKKDQADFIDCTIFGKRTDALANYTSKGSKISVTGCIRTESYEVEGKKRKSSYVLVEDFEFLDAKKTEQADEPEETIPGGFASLGEEDIPF